VRSAVLLCTVVLAGCGTSSPSPRLQPAKSTSVSIVKVVDGDTIKVHINGTDQSVRLIGIDTPETHKPGVKVECGGKEASANMARLAPVGAKVTLTYDPSQGKVDRYGRILAYAGVNHKSLELEQLYAGLAEVYVYQHKNFARVESYKTAEGVAKRENVGVWKNCSGDFHSNQPTT
jgi:micrococcal nuclease